MYYTIIDDKILTSDKEDSLTAYYDNVLELPKDYEQDKYIAVNGELVLNEKYEEELARQEKERIAKLFLTGADVERGIYKAKDMDFSDIVAMLETNPPKGLDIKALKIELKANNFYRGNPYVEAVGKLLGFTDKQLTRFFETNDYKELLYEDTTDTTEPTINADEVL